ncbi:MAG TPA: hypothetical protein VKI20_11210, partial [Acidimicrobiales bacterium]|nr:hypothetical protein [Acidimicrobiales bacterium]
DVLLCDRCADKRVAAHTGYAELPEPPPPFTATDAYGRRLTLRFRLWRAPTGIEMELEDADLEPRAGFHLAVLGPHDADVSELEAHLRRRAAEELGRRQLFPNKYRQGWVLADDRDEIAGRLTWSDEGNEVGTPYDVIVDGRTLTWEEIGRALEGYEGWRLHLVLDDAADDLRPDADVVPLHGGVLEEHGTAAVPAAATPAVPSIDELLSAFLADQRVRLSDRTYSNYAHVIELLRSCLANYGHQHLSPADQARFHEAYETDEEAFLHLFGSDELVAGIPEFLGYFMVRKVMAGTELLKAAGTVTKKLANWLGQQGHLDAGAVADTAERGVEAARDLPRAERLSELLYDLAGKASADVDALDDDDYVEDYLFIERVEPGSIWFEGGIGPLKVSKAASDLAKPGWSVNVVLARVRGAWQLVEVGNVYP